MKSAPVLRVVVLATGLMWCGDLAVRAQAPGAPAVPANVGPAPLPPTPLEQAVIEHACHVPGQAMLAAEAYDACLGEQLAGLRVEFGRDLQKLSAAERRTIDRACTNLRIERGRDAYVACLDQRLTSLVIARGRTRPAVSLLPVAPPPAAEPVAPPPTDVPVAPVAPAPHSRSPWTWVGLVAALVAAAGGFAAWKSRQRPAVALCRVCGELANAGDLCAACRHELAATQRRAAAERGEQAHAVAEAASRAQEEAEARQRELQQAALEAQRREREAARQAEEQRAHEHSRRREVDHRRWQEAAAATLTDDGGGTPHSVLGVAPDASPADIRTAYEAASAKYAAEQVAHLGVELQDHYRRKREAVEQAFASLSASSAPEAGVAGSDVPSSASA